MILVDWIRIQVGKMTHKKEKSEDMYCFDLKYWVFSFEG
jgi:hypothetical protein